MPTPTPPIVAAVPPSLVGTCIDRLQRLPRGASSAADRLMLVAVCTGRDEHEAAALFVRLITAAFVWRDPRWRKWRAAAAWSFDAAVAFEALALELLAGLPLEADLPASVDHFFAALATRISVRGRA